MAKRRTRKDKEGARHQHLISWNPESKQSEADSKNYTAASAVKGQSKPTISGTRGKDKGKKYAYYLDKNNELATIRHDLVKSLIIASLILCLELVIYLNQ